MEKTKKAGSEITVRISLTFQEAPDVHTLLAMTPVRARGKLVRLALERYIQETGHVSGNLDVQIAAISDWLRNRNEKSEQATHYAVSEEKDQSFLPIVNQSSTPSSEDGNFSRSETPINDSPGEPNQETEKPNLSESASMKRWLAS
jgi:hypothetical protein